MTSTDLAFTISGSHEGRRLRVAAPSAALLADFEGEAADGFGGAVLDGPLSTANAAAVRRHAPWLTPVPIGLATSMGAGDRLGVATPSVARAFHRHGAGVTPVFAQQSAREMDRLGRSPQSVLDDATFGCVQAGWTGPVGADADHLKSTDEIDRCLSAGFTLFTLDPGERVQHIDGPVLDKHLESLPWSDLEDDLGSMTRRYAGVSIDLGDSMLRLQEDDIRRAAAKYGAAVAYTVKMYRHLIARATYSVEVEVSVDETADVTTLSEHVYLATEMKRLGVRWVSFAPRHVGSFEKGVDYIGDATALYTSLMRHTNIARAFGPYKISLHSGSDKFSIYEGAAEATGRLVHLKTSGTHYLAAVDVASRFDPELFRMIYTVSREAYRGARASYQVSARLDRTPEPADVPDDRLHELVTAFDSRQILHVGYGAVLRTEDGQGASDLAASLGNLLAAHNDSYESALEAHVARHLIPFSETR